MSDFPYTIRPADADCLADVLAMLPAGMQMPTQVFDYAISDQSSGKVVAALQTSIQPAGDAGLRMGFIFGLNDKEKQDSAIPFALLCAKALARRAKASTVVLEMPLEMESDIAKHLEDAYFIANNPMTRYRLDVKRTYQRTKPVWERLQKRGKVPEGYEFVSLLEASPLPLAQLLKQTGLGAGALPDTNSEAGKKAAALCTVLRKPDSVLAGIMVVNPKEINDADLHVPGFSVLPDHQNSWAFTGILYHTMEKAREAGFRTMHFEIREHNPLGNTQFSNRMGGEPGERLASYAFPLEEG